MKKESKNLGVRRQCWNCPSIIARNINLTGTGYWISRCPKCLQDNEITIGGETHVSVAKPKTLLKSILLTVFILMALTPAILYVHILRAERIERVTCKHDYEEKGLKQPDAQRDFNDHKDDPAYARMDGDGDGKACEDLPIK